MPALSVHGLAFRKTSDGWQASRSFPFLPTARRGAVGGDKAGDKGAADEESEILIELAEAAPRAGEPTAAQRKALEQFLANERTICEALLDAVVRHVKAARKRDPDWFEDIPVVRSRKGLAKLLEFQGLRVLNQEHDGEALVGFGFACEWDSEHGFGVATHRGHVVEIGAAESSFAPIGHSQRDGVFNEEQSAAWQAVFGERVGDEEDAMARQVEKMVAQRIRQLQKAAESDDHGPALRALTRMIPEHPGMAIRITLDMPSASAPTPAQKAVAALQDKLIRDLEQALGAVAVFPTAVSLHEFEASLFGAMGNALRGAKFLSQSGGSQTAVEIFLWLGESWAMWNWVGQVGTKRLDAGPWPAAFVQLAKQWPGATPRLDSIIVLDKGSKPKKKSPLGPAVLAAVCELFQVAPPEATAAGSTGKKTADGASEPAGPLAHLRGGPEGIRKWNALSVSQRQYGGPYRKADLSNVDLEGANLAGLDFQKANFDGSRLRNVILKAGKFQGATFRKARIEAGFSFDAKLQGCDFTGADLRNARFFGTNLEKAVFRDADLTGATLTMAKVKGADFSTAKLPENVFEIGTEFDENTKFPAGYRLPGKSQLEWKGKGRDPRSAT